MSAPRFRRAGIIGAGGIGRVHIDGLRRLGVEVVAVCGSTAASSASLARDLNVPHGAADAAELVALPEVDVVHVCTPNSLHREQTTLALEAGKHVVCEKPLATSIADAEAMRALAEERSLSNATAYAYRFFPMVAALRRAVAAGELGRVHLVRGAYLNDEVLGLRPGHWLLTPELVGDALILADTGVHLWDMIEYVTGQRVVEVVARRQVARPSGGPGEDSAAALLRLSDGAVAVIAVSGAAPGHANTLEVEVLGSEASRAWSQEDPDALWAGRVGAASLRVRDASSASPGTLQMPPGHVQGYLDAFRDFMASVYIDRGAHESEPCPTFADGVRGVQILTALLTSAREDRWVEVPGSST